jgi:hypothetical protein
VTAPDALPTHSVFVLCDSSIARALTSADWLSAYSKWAESVLVTFPDHCLGPASRLLRACSNTHSIAMGVSRPEEDHSPQLSLKVLRGGATTEGMTSRQLPLMHDVVLDR